LSVDVKAWGYALGRLRSADEARVLYGATGVATVSPDVPLDVVVAPAQSKDQRDVFEEAQEIFRNLDARVLEVDNVAEVATRAEALLGRGQMRVT
jgi:hypothetical protein